MLIHYQDDQKLAKKPPTSHQIYYFQQLVGLEETVKGFLVMFQVLRKKISDYISDGREKVQV